MSRMKDRQEQVERMYIRAHSYFGGTNVITRKFAEFMVDSGIGDKDRFEVSYIDSIPSGQVRIKPKTYKENNNEEVSDNIR